ncbi:MAG: hypothetical protein AAGI68_12155 [Planctomycetota bacterium]
MAKDHPPPTASQPPAPPAWTQAKRPTSPPKDPEQRIPAFEPKALAAVLKPRGGHAGKKPDQLKAVWDALSPYQQRKLLGLLPKPKDAGQATD